MLLTAAFRHLLVGVIFSAPLLLAAAPVSQTLLPRARVDVPQLTLPASQPACLAATASGDTRWRLVAGPSTLRR
ncbi:hypothetical protein [Erwinia aphidicola]|uniref:Uncharacterized protein n=1 Tax=Erwinia aphidicola TaxID=68334 RepID=A0ABU8DD11_ERWAP